MALDLEEQEQLAELKAWWARYGNLIVAVVVGAALAIGGWQAWRWYERNQAAQAAMLYEALGQGVQKNDPKAVRDAAGSLIEGYPRTLYAAMAGLASARFHFDRGDLKTARAQLQWVTENARTDEFRDLARLRLAALLLDEKSYDEALKLLAEKHAAAFEAQYAALRGDVLVAKSQPAEARESYKAALDKSGRERESSGFRESVRIRLEALGG